jgi:hypothetical protein
MAKQKAIACRHEGLEYLILCHLCSLCTIKRDELASKMNIVPFVFLMDKEEEVLDDAKVANFVFWTYRTRACS